MVSQVQGFAPGDLQGLFAHDRFHLEEGVGMDLRVGYEDHPHPLEQQGLDDQTCWISG